MNHTVNFIPKKILLIVPKTDDERNLNNVLIIYHMKKKCANTIFIAKYFQHYLLYRIQPQICI